MNESTIGSFSNAATMVPAATGLLVAGLALSCSAQRSTSPAAAPAAATIADASAACATIQRSEEVPVACESEYIDGIPSIVVRFRNLDEGRRWMGPFSQRVGDPFCEAANRANRRAHVYMTVETDRGRKARRWSCEFSKWGSWGTAMPHAPNGNSTERPPVTLHDVLQTCERIQENDQLPIACKTEIIQGYPAMVVGFLTAGDAETYFHGVINEVSGPFCLAANQANRRAALYVTIADTRARRFDCAQSSWGQWFDLAPAQDSNVTALY